MPIHDQKKEKKWPICLGQLVKKSRERVENTKNQNLLFKEGKKNGEKNIKRTGVLQSL